MTPEQVVLLLLVALGGALTVVLLGCLRTLADLRLELASTGGRAVSGDALAAGRSLPQLLIQELPWVSEDGLIVFLSSNCPLCSDVVSILPELRIENLAFVVLGEGDAAFVDLPRFGTLLSPEVTRAALEHFELDYMPIGIHQRDGVIVGTIHTEALVSPEEVERFWRVGGARLLEAAA